MMIRLFLFIFLIYFARSALPKLNIDISQTSVVGISSGAFMAVQMHFAFSESIKRAGVVAGGPYYCAINQIGRALTACMKTPLIIDDPALEAFAYGFEKDGLIDELANLKESKVFLFSGTKDTEVHQGVMEHLETMYGHYGADVTSEFDINAEHAWITDNYGNSCSNFGAPYINNCGYNLAANIFYKFFKNVTLGTSFIKENLIKFDQTKYLKGKSFDENGYVYIPNSCKKNTQCRVLVMFHGCLMGIEEMGTLFIEHMQINELAEVNNVVVLFPQVKKSDLDPLNPQGCWDWWGYTNEKYAIKSGHQMNAVWQMVNDLAGIEQKMNFLD